MPGKKLGCTQIGFLATIGLRIISTGYVNTITKATENNGTVKAASHVSICRASAGRRFEIVYSEAMQFCTELPEDVFEDGKPSKNMGLAVYDSRSSESSHPGFHLRLSFLPVAPYVTNAKEIPGGFEANGYLPRLVQALSQAMDFTYNLDMPPDKHWGIRLPNGTWNGLIDMLLRNDTDLVIGAIGVTEARAKVIRYTRAHFVTEISLVASSGKQGPTSFFTFLLSFDSKIWIAVTFAFIVMVCVSAMSDTLMKNYSFNRSLYDYFWMYLSASFSEGSPRDPHSGQGKLLLSLWLLTILIQNNVFAALFKAVLTVDADADIIHTVEELANKEDHMLIIPAASIFEYCFKFSEKREYQRLYQRALSNRKESLIVSSLTSQRDLYQKVKTGKVVFTYNGPVIKYYIGHFCNQFIGNRKFYFIDETFFPYEMAFVVRLDFPRKIYKDINKRIQWLIETGLTTKWLEEELRDYYKCQAQQQASGEPTLELVHLLSVFYIFMSLQLLSMLALLSELLYKNIINSDQILISIRNQ